jgi:hypothetical protein
MATNFSSTKESGPEVDIEGDGVETKDSIELTPLAVEDSSTIRIHDIISSN